MSAPVQPALDALLARLGLSAARSVRVSNLDCEIHRIALARPQGRPDLPNGVDLALRIYPADRLDRHPIEAELTWLQALGEQGLLTPRPLADADGDLLHRWQPDPAAPARHAVLLTWVVGRQLDRGLRPVHLERVGELTARLHNTAERLVAQRRIASVARADQPDLAGWATGAYADDPRLTDTTHQTLRAAAQRLLVELANFSQAPAGHGWIHGDLHPWNLLFQGCVAGAIDFSECGHGHHAQDLACTLQYLRYPWVANHDHQAAYPALREHLLTGYARWRTLPPGLERQIDTYIASRMINTVQWILNYWPRVDLRPWGPAFLERVGEALSDWAG